MKVIAIPTQEISMIVQEKLFELGYEWLSKNKTFFKYPVDDNGKETYICLHEEKKLSHCNRDYYLKEFPEIYEEITMYDLFQMKSDTIELTNKNGEVMQIPRKSLEDLIKIGRFLNEQSCI